MNWKEIFPKNTQPSMEQISEYIGGDAKKLWLSIFEFIEKEYKIKPKFSYSICAGKPGWNVKLQKSGVSYGTFYPEENSFSVLLVISYKLDKQMEAILPGLTSKIAELYRQAGDYMKIGKWLMFQIKTTADIEDYKKIVLVKRMG
jgi:hypothetical protein